MEPTRESYKHKMQGRLKQWGNRLESLQLKVEKAGADTKEGLLADLAELKRLEVAGKQHLASVEKSAINTWDSVKTELIDKWSHVSGAVDAIWERVHGTGPIPPAAAKPETKPSEPPKVS